MIPCMPCSFGPVHSSRSEAGAQRNNPLRVTVTVRCIPLVTAAYGTRVARPARTTRLAPGGDGSQLDPRVGLSAVTTASWASREGGAQAASLLVCEQPSSRLIGAARFGVCGPGQPRREYRRLPVSPVLGVIDHPGHGLVHAPCRRSRQGWLAVVDLRLVRPPGDGREHG
jgi:hypothetical protein